MNEVAYVGEHLLPRYVGHAALLIAFFAAILSTVSYYLATRHRAEVLRSRSWGRLGQLSFLAHGAAVFTVIGMIFYAMLNQYYEYQYVQAHVSADLSQRYIFSAFWEGQEGSFLLWMFWHVILGYVLMVTARQWERPVIAVLGSVQVIIVSMLLGVHFGVGDLAIKLGSNPLLLLREAIEAPIFQQADYVELLKGNGLNPSLQNYWMTIHPPTLFLGFASTVVPFAFAVAGLWTGKHREWLAPGLRWSLFSAGILGVGILMGSAWAYEALNFGGYWAWDPVENASLVPWLMLVAGVHTNLISRATGQGIRATYLFYLFTFVFIIYSTFLTRSGVLGDTSVHAFTEMGLEAQLLFFLLFYTVLSLVLMAWRWRSVPVPEKEESLASREFWMFIGSLILLMSSVLIIGATSLPVYNKIVQLFDPVYDGLSLTDPEAHHNRFQIWIAVFMGLATSVAHMLRWRERRFSKHRSYFLKHLLGGVAGAGVLTGLTLLVLQAPTVGLVLMLFAGWFTVVSNLDFAVQTLGKNPRAASSVMSHVGFGLMLVGILASATNKRIVSRNQFLMEGLTADEELARTTVTLFKDTPLGMEDLELTFTGDTIDGLNRTYFVDYIRRDRDGNPTETFRLEPNVLYDKGFEKIAITNPSTKHYLDRDIFTVIMSLPEEEQSIEARQEKEESLAYKLYPLREGQAVRFVDTVETRRRDTFELRNYQLELADFTRRPDHPDYIAEAGDLGISATVRLTRLRGRADETTYEERVALIYRDGLLFHYPAQIDPLSTRIKIDESIFDELLVAEDKLDYREFVVREGEEFTVGDKRFTFETFNPAPTVDHYAPVEGDIAVGALLRVRDAATETTLGTLQPVFVIREKQPHRVRDELRQLGLFAAMVNLDPETGAATLQIAQTDPREALRVPIAVATNSLRADWIGLQAIEFPGINLFWGGTILMMLGLLVGASFRRTRVNG